MGKELTARQLEILNYLVEYQKENSLMPSTREVQAHFGFSSQTAVIGHLKALEAKGAIRRLNRKARAVILKEEEKESEQVLSEIPLVGEISAGFPQCVESQKSEGTPVVRLDLQAIGMKIPKNAFLLKVRGESMIGAHICDGDWVLLEKKAPIHGDVVAALIDGETTLKRYQVKSHIPVLVAENDKYPNFIPARQMMIQGVMVGLLRSEKC